MDSPDLQHIIFIARIFDPELLIKKATEHDIVGDRGPFTNDKESLTDAIFEVMGEIAPLDAGFEWVSQIS